MARKTIKGLEVIITDLEKRLNEQNKINVELHNQISQMQMIADDKFENSPIYHQMVKEIEQLKTVIRLNEINTKSKEDTIKRDRDTIQKLLKEIEELKSNNVVNKLKNERVPCCTRWSTATRRSTCRSRPGARRTPLPAQSSSVCSHGTSRRRCSTWRTSCVTAASRQTPISAPDRTPPARTATI